MLVIRCLTKSKSRSESGAELVLENVAFLRSFSMEDLTALSQVIEKGEYALLEINPSGQWLFMEERTGQPITAAMARLFATQDIDP
jgi:hypothetical protein